MPSILDYDFGSRLNKFVEKIPKFYLKGCFGTSKLSYEPQPSTEPVDVIATMQELSQMLTQAAMAVPTKQAYKVAKALSSTYSMDIGMKYLVANLSKFPEEALSYTDIEELCQSCLRQFPDSYAQEFFKKDIVRLAQNDMDVDFLTKVAATITSQSDFEHKIKQLKFEGSNILNVDKRQFLLAHINESLNIEDTFPCDTIVEEEHLGYIKKSHKKYMADVYKDHIAENLQRVMEKNAKFEIPDAIDFSGFDGEPLYDESTYFWPENPEYQLLHALGDQDRQEYLDKMYAEGVSVLYDSVEDVYIVSPTGYNTDITATYEIPEEIDFRTCTASMSLKVGSDRMEYHLLNNLWNDEVTKATYCAEMKNAGVIVAYNEDDTYSIEKECDTTEASNEHKATIEIPDEIDFSYYDGETLYFGADTVEYQLLSELGEDAWIEYLDEMATVGVTVEYDNVDDVFEVESSLYGDVEEDGENEHEAKKKSVKSYEVPKEIDYRNYTSAIPLRFGTNTAEYKLLNGMSKAELIKYKEEMSKNGVAVTYDEKLDKFIIQNGVKTAEKIEKIWIVENPKATSTIEDILFETTIGGLENQFKGGLSKNDIAATFTTEAEAKEFAEKLLKEKTSNKKADKIEFGKVPKKEFLKMKAVDSLGLKWDNEGYWVDKDEMMISDEDLSLVVDNLSTDTGMGMDFYTLKNSFDEISEHKKEDSYKKTKELEDLGQQRLPNIANKKKVAREYYFQQEGWKIYSDGWEIEAPEGGTIWAEKDDKGKVFWLNKDNTIDTSEEEFDKVYKSFKQYIKDTKGYKHYIEGNKQADSYNRDVVKILPENQGYDISVYINGEKVKTNWKKDYQSAYQAARIFADFYKDENGQSLNIKPYHNIESKKADLIPTPVNMPEQEIYTRLTNETKEALSKIKSRAAELKILRDEHLQVHGELDEAKNKLAEEKQRISAELSGYLDISENSFTKICVALTVAETLEAQEEVILNAITTSIDKVIEANEKAIPEDAANILDILKHMGTIVDNIVVEAKNEITKMSEGVNYVRHALRKKQVAIKKKVIDSSDWITKRYEDLKIGDNVRVTRGEDILYIGEVIDLDNSESLATVKLQNGKTKKFDYAYLEGVEQVKAKRQATIDEGRFWPWIKTSIFGAKKFYGFTDRNVDSFVNDYGNLVKILLNY